MLETVEAIVLKSQNYGETHKIITIYSKEIGKLTAICRGANRTKSRLSALTQPFIKASFLIYLSKGLSTVQQGEVIESYRKIREDIIKTAYAAYAAELFDKLTEAKEANHYLYKQLELTLGRINDEEQFIVPILMLELKLYKKSGFAPTVDHCVSCQSEAYPFSFSIREGGLLCSSCRLQDEHAVLLPNAVAKLLPVFLNVGLERIGTISFKKENEKLLRRIFDEYYDQFGGYALKSRRFLAQLNLLE